MLVIGNVVEVFKKAKCIGVATIFAINSNFITLDYGKYKATIYNMDLRQRDYILKSNGVEISFNPVTDAMKDEAIKLKKDLEEYRQNRGKSSYQSMMKIKNIIEEDTEMSKIKVTEEQLIEELKVLGFHTASYSVIAKKYGTDAHSVSCKVSKLKLREKIEVKTEKPEVKVKKVIAAPEVEAKEIILPIPAGKPQSSLKPTALKDLDSKFEYSLFTDGVLIKTDTDKVFSIDYSMIDEFIKELQEIKQLAV